MPDWRTVVRTRLAVLSMQPTTEFDVADEIAQHLEDRVAALQASGLTEAAAAEQALTELDSHDLLSGLQDVFPNH